MTGNGKSTSPAGTYGWGIIGTGRIAVDFASDLKLLPQARLAGVLSRGKQSADEFVGRMGAGLAYSDLTAFLADPSIDIVYVATPNSTHVPMALSAIRAGKAVLIEKPAALAAADIGFLQKEAALHRSLVMEAMWIRFLPGIAELKQLIDRGEIGKVLSLQGSLAWKNAYDPKGRLFDPTLGGGASLDLGVYLLSLTMYLMGEPLIVDGHWTAAPSGVDMRTSFRLRYADSTAELECGLDRDGHNVFEIKGTEGMIRISDPFIRARRIEVAKGSTSQALMKTAGKGLGAKLLSRMNFPGHSVRHFPYPGHGLSCQADALMRAMANDASKVDTMPLEASAAVLRVISEVLAKPPKS